MASAIATQVDKTNEPEPGCSSIHTTRRTERTRSNSTSKSRMLRSVPMRGNLYQRPAQTQDANLSFCLDLAFDSTGGRRSIRRTAIYCLSFRAKRGIPLRFARERIEREIPRFARNDK